MVKDIILCTENPATSLVYQALGGAVRLISQGQLGSEGLLQSASKLYIYEGVVDHAVWTLLMNVLKMPGIDLLVVTESIQGVHEEQLYLGGVADVVVRKGINLALMQIMLERYRSSYWNPAMKQGKPARVLMLDDECLWIDLLTQLGTPMIEVLGVTNESDFREALKVFVPDLVCLDIVLDAPSTGFDVLEAVYSSCRTNPKIVFCTNLKFTRYMIEAYRLGASGYIHKPFTRATPHRLIRVLGREKNEA